MIIKYKYKTIPAVTVIEPALRGILSQISLLENLQMKTGVLAVLNGVHLRNRPEHSLVLVILFRPARRHGEETSNRRLSQYTPFNHASYGTRK